MFGDAGHGILMFFAALWMVVLEKKFLQMKSDNEVSHTQAHTHTHTHMSTHTHTYTHTSCCLCWVTLTAVPNDTILYKIFAVRSKFDIS